MRRASAALRPLLCLVLLASCSVPVPPAGSAVLASGTAALSVLLPRGVSASRVTITASAPGITPLYIQLAFSNGLWSGLLEHVPAGAGRSFLAQVYDASGTLVSEGTTSGISVPPRQMTLVLVTVHAVDPPPPSPPPPVDESPRIVSAVQNGTTMIPGRPITFQVIAEDPRGGALTFAWAVNVGTLSPARSDATTSSVTWTAPDCSTEGLALTVTVRNELGLTTLQHFSLAQMIACHWSPTGAMAVSYSYHSATRLRSGQVLVVGDGPPTSEVYDPASGTWSLTGSMAVPRQGQTATLLPDGRVLIAGGIGPGVYLETAELYDPASGTWSLTGSMAVPRMSHTATLLPDGRVLVAGGYGPKGHLKTAEVYDPASGIWSPTGPMTFSREDHTATLLLDGTVLIAGGYVPWQVGATGSLQVTAELYDPASGTWSVTGDLSTAHQRTAAVRLSDGKVLLTGGGTDDSTSAEVYDPATRTWSAVRTMNTGRSGHTATLLPDGRVLVVGGSFESKVELYNPTSGTWSLTSPLATVCYSHQATPLLDGRVLISGQCRDRDGNVTTAELYTP